MKELKFTPENLQRHLRNDRRIITTTRDSYKGGCGTVFKIEGLGYFVVMRYEHYSDTQLRELCKDHYRDEGFPTVGAMVTELERLYPDSKDFYVYQLTEVFLD